MTITRPRHPVRSGRRSLAAGAGLSAAAMLLAAVPSLPARAAPFVGTVGTSPAASGIDLEQRVDNPFAGSVGYVDPEWSALAAEYPRGESIARTPTAIWLDDVDSIAGPIDGPGTDGTAEPLTYRIMSLRQHLDRALVQQKEAGGVPLTVQVVLHDLPGRDCWRSDQHGEMAQDRIDRYRSLYIDRIWRILAVPAFRSLRIAVVVEPMALPSLVAGTGSGHLSDACRRMLENGNYVEGIQYALDVLGQYSNVYLYLDLAHHGFIGWQDTLEPTLDLVAKTVRETKRGPAGVTGFTVNVANYGATVEPFYTVDNTVAGTSVRASRWVDWNWEVDEQPFALGARARLITHGFPPTIGMVIDTSRNGWGGADRPTGPSASQDVNTFVDGSRTDRRHSATYGWCNQEKAGLGARPTASPVPGIDAYAWIKPPGESDGSYPSNHAAGLLGTMCDPDPASSRSPVRSGAMPEAPRYGEWFGAHFVRLLENAYPRL